MWTREQVLCDDARKEVSTARMRVGRVRIHLKDVYRSKKVDELLKASEDALKELDEKLLALIEAGDEA